MNIKKILVFLCVFLLIMYLQNNDDIRFNNKDKRKSLFDKIKLPLIVSLIVILIIDINYMECYNYIKSLFYKNIQPIENDLISEALLNNNLLSPNKMSASKPFDDVFVGPAPF